MKFQRTSLILVFIALVLGGLVYYLESRNPPKQEETTAEAKPIFAFKEADVQAFTVQKPKQTIVFEKTGLTIPLSPNKASGKPDFSSSPWLMKQPEQVSADEGAVAFLLNLMVTGRSDRVLPIPAARKSEFGLDQPSATVEVKLANQQTHRLILGKPNFNRNFLYALADPSANESQGLSVLLVPIDFQNAVDRPLREWKRDKPKPSVSPAPPIPSAPPTPR